MALFRSLATVGGFTGLSRVLGFLRDILIAAVLGTGPVADAFFVAFRLPNLFRRLFAEGALNAAFVPLFARRIEEEGLAAAKRFAEEVLAVLLSAMLVLCVIAIAAMPWLMHVLAPGFAADPEKFDQAVQLARIAFPYILFMALVALYGGVLNSLYRFTAFAAAPVVLNLFFIAALVAVVPLIGEAGLVLAWTVAAAGLGQLLWLVWAAKRAGVSLRLHLPRLTPGVKRTLRLMGPGALSAGALQFNIVIGTIIASLQAGAVSYLYYADRVYQLPLALIGIALGIVLLPDLSRKVRAKQHDAAVASLNRGLEVGMLFTLPAAAALVVIAWPIISVLFERGAFDATAAQATALALAAFSLGLPAYVGVKIMQPAFFAREDTVSPLKAAATDVAVSVMLAVTLFFFIGYVGIALATAAAAWVNVGLLALWLRRAGFLRPDARFKRRAPRMAGAAVGMAAALLAGQWALMDLLTGGQGEKIAALLLLVGGGMALYGALALLLGAADLGELRALFRRRGEAAPVVGGE